MNIKLKFKKAFTIAEAIAVLVILGIVSAIVIPTTQRNIYKRETLTRFQRAYSMLTEITERSRIEYGYPPEKISNETLFNNYFKPYLNISKVCGNVLADNLGDNRCFAGPKGGIYTMDNGAYENPSSYGDFYKVVLQNGMSLGVRSKNGFGGITIIVDVNGPHKGYSKLGQDTFFFTWASPGQLKGGSIKHQTEVPELIPGGLNWYSNPFYYQTSTYSTSDNYRRECRAMSSDEIELKSNGKYTEMYNIENQARKDKTAKCKEDKIAQGKDPTSCKDDYSEDFRRDTQENVKNENGERVYTDGEINTYVQLINRSGNGVPPGSNCSVKIVRDGLKFSNDYPWAYANEKPKNFTPVR